MDLFDYAQELYDQQGDLWVPGLGHFSKKRNSARYDADTETLYPPRYESHFDEDLENTDESFVAYFSGSKNLSQGSAKYFVDKFVDNIKTQLATGEVRFGGLGTLYKNEEGQIALKGSDLESGALYGLPVVKIGKVGSASEEIEVAPQDIDQPLADLTEEELAARNAETISEGDEPTGERPRRAYDPNSFFTDDRVLVLKGKPQRAEQSNRYQFWTLAILVAVIVIGGIFFLTQNYLAPVNEDGSKGDVSNQILSHAVRSDTVVNTYKAKQDSEMRRALANQPSSLPTTIDTTGMESALGSTPNVKGKNNSENTSGIPKDAWLLQGGQNNNYGSAQRLVDNYHKMGYPEARMVDSTKRQNYFVYKVIFGFYNTAAEADAARTVILQDKKISPKSLTVQKNK